MQYLRNLQSQLSESLWIRSHREPNFQGDCNSSKNSSNPSSAPNLATFTPTTRKRTETTRPPSSVVVVANFENSQEEQVSNKHHHASREKVGSLNRPSKALSATATPAPIIEIKSLVFTTTNNNHQPEREHSSVNPYPVPLQTPQHRQQQESFFGTNNNFLLPLHQNKSKESSLLLSSSSSSPQQEQAEPVILSLTPLSRSAKRDYFKNSRSRSSTGSHFFSSVTDSPSRKSASAQFFKGQGLNNNNNKGNVHDSPIPSARHHPKNRDKDKVTSEQDVISVRSRERIENLERLPETSSRPFPQSTDKGWQASRGNKSLTDPVERDELLVLPAVNRNEWTRREEKANTEQIDWTDDENETSEIEGYQRKNGNVFPASKVNSELSTLLLPLNSSPSSLKGTHETSRQIAPAANQQQQFYPASSTKLDTRVGATCREISNSKRRSSSIANGNIYISDSWWDRSDTFHNARRSRQIHSCNGKLRSADSTIAPTNSAISSIKSISKCVQEKEEEEETALRHYYQHYSGYNSEERLSFPGSPSPTKGASVVAEGEEAGVAARRDQSSPTRSSSRFTAFTRDAAFSSGSSTTSTDTLIDSADFYSDTHSESSAPVPVVQPRSSNVVLPVVGDSAISSNNSAVVVEGLSCSHKVNQRKKSIINNHHNNRNSGSNNSNSSYNTNKSELPIVHGRKYQKRVRKGEKRKRSIIQSLLCTNGFNLVDSPKKLLCALFHPRRNKHRTAANNNSKTPPRTPSLSLSSSYSASSPKSGRTRKSYQKLGSVGVTKEGRRQRRGPTKADIRLWVTMDHEDLIRELPQIEKLSNQERLRLAHKRRMLQLKKFGQYEKDLNSNSKKHRGDSDLVRRNLPGKHHNVPHGQIRKGSRRIRFRNSIMLLEAAGRNDVEEVRLLLESGVNPDVANEDGLTALHQCCIDDNEEMMKLLLDFGANVNAEDSERWTPLHAAATCGHLHLVQYLIDRSANLLGVNAEGNMPYDICDDETTLDYIESEMAKRGVTQELIEEIRALPETRMLQDIQRVHVQGGDLEFRDVDGATPLHIASANGYYRVAEFLLDNHAATDVQDKDFWQPIHAAACWGHLDVLELLVQNGADLDARTKNNETPYAICEDPEIKERIITLRTEQQTKRQNEGRKRPSRTHSTNSRTQSIRRTSQRDKGLTSKRDAADEAQMLRAREELNKENSPSPTSDATTNGTAGNNNTTSVSVNGNGVAHPVADGQVYNNVHQNGNGNASSEEDQEISYPPTMLGRDSVSNMKMKQDDMNRLKEIAVRSGAINHTNHHLNNQNNHHNNTSSNNANTNAGTGIKMNNLYNNEATNGSLRKNQNNIHKNLNTSSNGASDSTPVSVMSSPDDNGNLLPKPDINPSVDNKVPLGGGLSSGVSLSGSRDNLVGLSSSAGNSTIDIHVSVTINTNSPVSTLTNGKSLPGNNSTNSPPGHGHNTSGLSNLALSPGSSIFTTPGTLSDLKKQRSLIRTSSNPLTNGGINDAMAKYHPPASPTMSLRRYVGDPAETVGDYGDGGKRCCVIV